jgi:hypothetical protein
MRSFTRPDSDSLERDALHGALQREAFRLESEAASLGARYARTSWLRFAGVFIPVPFAVALLRLELAAWHYYVAGAAYVVLAFGLYALDTRLSERRDRAVAAAERARLALSARALSARACGARAISG